MTNSAEPTSAPRALSVLRGDELRFSDHPSEPGEGVSVALFPAAEHGASHLSVALVDLQPGASIRGHRHPFEESFYVLEGTPIVAIADRSYALTPDDFGLVPMGFGHAWSNPSRHRARLLRIHAPQPRPIGGEGEWGVFDAPETAVPTAGLPVDELDPSKPFTGHFAQADMAPPGSISMPGYHGANVQNVQIRMMVDELLGARHHAMFIVQFQPKPGGVVAKTAKEHFHPFDEVYYLVSGATKSFSDGNTALAEVGDLISAPVGASHGFAPLGNDALRWIEIQSPLPPASGGFTFHNDWAAQVNIG